MKYDLSVDYATFARQVDELARVQRITSGEALREQARLLTQDLLSLTPPLGKKPLAANRKDRDTYGEQREAGKKAIRGDIKRLFVTVEDLKLKNPDTDDALKRLARRGDPARVKEFLQKLGFTKLDVALNASAILHKYNRTKAGRTRRGVTFLVLRSNSVKQLLTGLLAKVGMAKAGWVPAAQKLGLKGIPLWISNHTTRTSGYIQVQLQREPMFIEVGNRVGYIQKYAWRIVSRALRNRIERMRNEMDNRLNKAFKGYGKSGKYARTK